ncbi:hypothetical protein HK099_007939 [Clydaea vesicula]|uniref:RRM domain-containing protein n=1 Tax=Clydaea vesicula TaxID=447962 RepID=A0AAD5U6H0_9FUNG|nr:hypothetical protein HK099_007939 [Clydaea vesicula]
MSKKVQEYCLFLLGEIAKNENGFVSLDTLLSFNRLKSISEDKDLIKEALKDSEFLEVDDEKNMVKRTTQIQKTILNWNHGVYVSGFPEDLKDIVGTAKEIFNQFGNVNFVKILRNKDKLFKGDVLIDFNAEEPAAKALEKKTLEYNGSTLKIIKKNTFYEEIKNKEYGTRKKDRYEEFPQLSYLPKLVVNEQEIKNKFKANKNKSKGDKKSVKKASEKVEKKDQKVDENEKKKIEENGKAAQKQDLTGKRKAEETNDSEELKKVKVGEE